MPNTTLDLSDIKLPEADADKEHGSDVTPITPEQEAEQAKIQAEQKAKEDADAAAAKAKEDAEAAKGKTPEEIAADEKAAKSAADAAAAEAKAKEDKEKEDAAGKPAPFHEHPDWIKMQRELEETKKQLADVTANKDVTPDKKEEARKTADEKLQADLDGGWEPKSQAEIMMRGLKYMREDLEAQLEDKEKAKAETAQSAFDEERSIVSLAQVAYDDLGIKEIEQRRVVGKYLADLVDQGIIAPISSKNIQTAIKWGAEQLKATGKLTAPAADDAAGEKKDPPEDKKETKPEETAEQKATREAEEKKKSDVNARITKPAQDSTPPGQKQKKSYASMHTTSLDEISFNAGKDL